MKEKRLLILLNFGPWVYIYIFNILCNAMGSTCEVFPLYTKSMMISLGKALVKLSYEMNQHFLHGTSFYWNEFLTNYAYLKLGIWQTFSKINEQSEPVASWKITDIFYYLYNVLRFQMKEFWELYTCHSELNSSSIPKDFTDEIGDDINSHYF